MSNRYFLCIVIAAAVVIAAIPFVYAVAMTPDGFTYSGRHNQNSGDYAVYFSQMEQARQGHITFYNLFENTPHRPDIFDPFWLALGWLCRITGMSAPIMFHVLRLLLIPFFALALWKFLLYLVQDERIRRIALCLSLFAGGLMGYAGTTDASPFNSMQFSPHLVASAALLCVVLLFFAKSIDQRKIRFALYAAPIALLLCLFHPYHLATLGWIIGAYIIARAIQQKHLTKTFWLVGFVLLGILLPVAWYYQWMFSSLPFGQEWLLQSDALMRTRNPWELFVAYVPLSALALLGLWWIHKDRAHNVFLYVWLIVPLVAMWLPVFFRMRMTGLWLVPIAILAAYAGHWLWQSKFRAPQLLQRAFLVLMVALCLITPITILSENIAVYTTQTPLAYVSKDLVTALEWYRDNTTQSDVLLTSPYVGNFAPSITGRTVYCCHGIQTIDADQKEKNIAAFFKVVGNGPGFLKKARATYMLYSPFEKELGPFDPDGAPYLQKVFERGEYRLYRLVP